MKLFPTLSARSLLVLALLVTGAYATTVIYSPAAEAAEKKKKKKKKKGAAATGDAKDEGEEGEEEEEASAKDAKKGDKDKKADKKDKKGDKKAAGPEEKKDEEPDPLKRAGAAQMKVESPIDQKQFDKSRQADQKRDEAIEELKKLIPKAPTTRKAEMIFRLAELYWQKSKFNYGLEMQKFEKAYTDWNDKGRPGKEPDQKEFTRESELIKQNALKLYEKVLAEFPTYERNDEVLFYLGYNEYEAGNKKKAVDHYWTLIKQFPQSKLVPQAYLQLGEHFFAENDVNKARKAYERALATNVAKVYNYALYKLSWVDYNLQEYAEGIKKLKDVIDRSETIKEKESVQLKSEALGDLARFFSYVDEIETAFDYFKKKGSEDIAIRYTTKLGDLFHEQGKWELEIKTYRMLNDKYPMHARAPTLQSKIVGAYSKLNQKDMVRKEVERLVDLYRPGTPWYKAQEKRGEKGKPDLEYAYDLTESNLRDLVTEYHQDAQKRKDVATYKLARDIYAKYLEAFNETDAAYRMRFFYAEVLWALKEWKNAAEQYDTVARTVPKEADKGGKGEFTRTASFNAILAWEKIIAEGETGKLDSSMKVKEVKDKGDVSRTETKIAYKQLEKGKTYNEEKIPENELKLSAACDLYFKIADQTDSDLPAIKFKAAWIYYKYNHFVAAAERYNEMIERWPGTDLSHKAANLILDSLNVQERWDELAKYARLFRDNKKLVGADKKFETETGEILEGATFKSVGLAENKAKALPEEEQRAAYAEVAKRFRAFQKEFGDSKFADKAVMNALVIYDRANELDNAIEAGELMMSKYEKSDLIPRAHFLLAGFYERTAEFDRAAKLYHAFYEKNGKHEKAADALFNAGVWYQGIGDAKKAVELFTKYTEEFASKPDVADVYWRTCEIHDGEKDWKKALECWGKFKDKYKSFRGKVFESRYKVSQDFEALKQKPQAVNEYKWLVAEFGKLSKKEQESPVAALAGAHAAFELLEPEFKSYSAMKITLNKKTLLEKANKAEELACIDSEGNKCKKPGKYITVLNYGNGDYGIAALTRMGQVFRGMAKSIREAPLPRGLDEDQIEIYKAELDNVALGPEEKAIQAFELALKKAYELNIYNSYTLTAQDNLRELNPNKFPDPQKAPPRGADTFQLANYATGNGAAKAGNGASGGAAKATPAAAAEGEDEGDGEEEGGAPEASARVEKASEKKTK